MKEARFWREGERGHWGGGMVVRRGDGLGSLSVIIPTHLPVHSPRPPDRLKWSLLKTNASDGH